MFVDRYDVFCRPGTGRRVGVSGSGSLFDSDAEMRGREGVGAVGDATLDSMNSTSSASMLSRLLPSVSIIGVGVVTSDDDVRDGVGLELCAFLRATASVRGESCSDENMLLRGLRLCAFGRFASPLALSENRCIAEGVVGEAAILEELEEEDDEDRDGMDSMTGGAGAAALEAFFTRVGDARTGDVRMRDGLDCGVGVFTFFSGVAGLTLMAALRFTCSAPLCGRGLIARLPLLTAVGVVSLSIGLPLSSLSSSEQLNFRRRPTRTGDGGFPVDVASMRADLGLYLGKPDAAPEFLGRSVFERTRVDFWLIVTGEDDSSDDVVPISLSFGSPDILRAFFVIVLVSGEELFSLVNPAATFSVVVRAPGGTRLLRLEDVSFVFFAAFSFSPWVSFPSLCMTSASAFPTDARFSDDRIEDLVFGRGRKTRPVLAVSMVVVAVVDIGA